MQEVEDTPDPSGDNTEEGSTIHYIIEQGEDGTVLPEVNFKYEEHVIFLVTVC